MRSNSSIAGQFLRFSLRYWSGPTAFSAWALSISLVAVTLAMVGTVYGINRWTGTFFNAIERKDSETIWQGLLLIGGLGLGAALLFGLSVWLKWRLQIDWRARLTGDLMERWLANQHFYHLRIAAKEVDAPEFRIAEDVRLSTEPLVDFVSGLLNSLVTATAFVAVLWNVGGSITLPIGDGITVPGYMVWVAAIYSLICSVGIAILGRPLVTQVERKNAAEAQLRTGMVRLGDNAENVALIRGEDDELRGVKGDLWTLVRRWRLVATQQAKIGVLSNANVTFMPIVPLLAAAPKYLAGAFPLGSVMQLAQAFVQVQYAFNWLFDNFVRLAEWFASATRVVVLMDAMDDLDLRRDDPLTSNITFGETEDDSVVLRNVSVEHFGGSVMIADADVVIHSGEKVLLTGESGTGKSTLVRAIAGLWPWGSGEILLPRGRSLTFMPQRPYIPKGTLRHALLYPDDNLDVDDAQLSEFLKRCGMSHLANRLHDADSWDEILSGGEQQRLAFARLLVRRPDIVVMDEATAALDEGFQASMMHLFETDLWQSTVISVGHRKELEQWHDRKLVLQKQTRGARIRSVHLRDSFFAQVSKVMQKMKSSTTTKKFRK